MKSVTLRQVAHDCGGTITDSEFLDHEVTDVATDNRAITGGELFVAIRGENVDGNRFANDALRAGATAVLTSDPKAAQASGASEDRIISVADPIVALGKLAKANLERVRESGNPDFKVVAVTGSVGKTTTKDLLASVLAVRGPIIAPPGSFNNELGLPLTVLRADDSTATLVLEMGADHVGNIEYLTAIAPPDVAVVLVVARAHLGEFGGIENVARAKSELVVGLADGGTAVLNADDERVRAMSSLARGPVITFSAGSQPGADVVASDVTMNDAGRARFTLRFGEAAWPVELRLVGVHHVTNALAAASAAFALGIDGDTIAKILSASGPASPHRMDVFERDGVTIIDDSYNANPDSMRAGVRALQSLGKARRKIAVLGEMLELGDASDEEHAALGTFVAEAGVDIAVCVGDGTSQLSQAAFSGGVQVYDVSDVAGASELLSTLLVSGDIVLLKGSNGSGIWKIADSLKGM